MLNLKKISTVLVALTLSSMIACSSKKKTEDEAAAPAQQEQKAPQIENTSMSFDAQGSDSGKIAGLNTVNFEFDKSALNAATKQKLQGNVDWMKANANVNIQIEGHCDSRGSIEYNLSLGQRRAQAVKDYMVSLGVSGSRLSIISYGKEKLLDNGDTEAAHTKNRRANFLPLTQ
jgi:peptidoglycan-associated lipoprotein